ncbi:hypothetical protein LTR53_014678 [Teratosphaeriaceae sp. CCFEE 6253]|nr:hypothetical protein LTR53_014678 [Teratosphaeriaceae sp. CCFEE 6253]
MPPSPVSSLESDRGEESDVDPGAAFIAYGSSDRRFKNVARGDLLTAVQRWAAHKDHDCMRTLVLAYFGQSRITVTNRLWAFESVQTSHTRAGAKQLTTVCNSGEFHSDLTEIQTFLRDDCRANGLIIMGTSYAGYELPNRGPEVPDYVRGARTVETLAVCDPTAAAEAEYIERWTGCLVAKLMAVQHGPKVTVKEVAVDIWRPQAVREERGLLSSGSRD